MNHPKIIRNKLLRAKVFERDQGICCDCGRFDPKWEHDHAQPLWQRGADTLDNSKTLCRHCHKAKTIGEAPVRAKADRIRERHDLTEKRRSLPDSRPLIGKGE